jgi:hypothetical protein
MLQATNRIRERTDHRVAHYLTASPRAIERRLRQLDREWDVGRMLAANASGIALAGIGLGALVDRRFYAVPVLAAGFLLQHALQGWCPPLALLRRLGMRTREEIEEERDALRLVLSARAVGL